jgi:hypothetical protein
LFDKWQIQYHTVLITSSQTTQETLQQTISSLSITIPAPQLIITKQSIASSVPFIWQLPRSHTNGLSIVLHKRWLHCYEIRKNW